MGIKFNPFTGNFDFVNDPVVYTEIDNGNSSSAATITWADSPYQTITLTAECDITFTPPSEPVELIFRIVQDSTGGRTINWPSDVKFPGGTKPVLTTAANAEDIIKFYYDGSSAYYGNTFLDYSVPPSFEYLNSINLGGTNEYVEWADNAALDITNNLSMNVWIKVSSGQSLGNSGVLSKYSGVGSNDSYLISINSNQPNVWVSANGGSTRKRYQINTTINDNTWHMITMTFSTNVLKLYLDGTEITGGGLTLFQDNTVNTIFSGNETLKIGSLDGTIWPFIGFITGASLWNTTVLSASDITALYNSGVPNIEPGNDTFTANAVFHVDFNQPGDDATGTTGQITDSVSGLIGTPLNTESGDIVSDAP